MASFMDTSGSLASAYRDLGHINELVQEVQINEHWLDDYLDAASNAAATPASSIARPPDTVTLTGLTTEQRMPFRIDLPLYYRWPYIYPRPDELMTGELTPFDEVERRPTNTGVSDAFPRYRLPHQSYQIQSLSDFIRLWDLLLATPLVHLIADVSSSVLVFYNHGRPLNIVGPPIRRAELLDDWLTDPRLVRDSLRSQWIPGSDQELLGSIFRNVDRSAITDVHPGVFLRVVDWTTLPNVGPVPRVVLSREFQYVRVIDFLCDDPDDAVCLRVLLPLAIVPFRINGQRHLVELLRESIPNLSWREGAFAEVFPELHSNTTFLSDLRFEDLLAHFQQERRRNGDRLDVFGLSIPSSAIDYWGPLFVVMLMLYFYLHLVKFNSISKSRPDVFAFPWIGFYAHPAAYWTLTVSVVAYPSAVSVYLAIQRDIFSLPVIPANVWLAFLVLLTGALAVSNYRELERLRADTRSAAEFGT